jgi:hypothetical protein
MFCDRGVKSHGRNPRSRTFRSAAPARDLDCLTISFADSKQTVLDETLACGPFHLARLLGSLFSGDAGPALVERRQWHPYLRLINLGAANV